MTTEWITFDIAELEEILACMEDSDRYIHEGRKMRIIASIKQEIKIKSNPPKPLLICPQHNRQYDEGSTCRDCQL